MKHTRIRPYCILAGVLVCASAVLSAEVLAEQVLFDFDKDFDVRTVKTQDAKVSLTARDGGRALRIATGRKVTWPGITLAAPAGRWDLSPFEHVALDVSNVGTTRPTPLPLLVGAKHSTCSGP